MTKMKPKGRWIEKYNLECDPNDIDENQTFKEFSFNSSDILKLNVKPKVVWFVQYMLSQQISSERKLEEGEIFSDDDDDVNFYGANCTLNSKEVIMPGYGVVMEPENLINVLRSQIQLNVGPTKYTGVCSYHSKDNRCHIGRRHNSRTVSVDRLWKPYSKLNHNSDRSNKFSFRKPLIESSRNSSDLSSTHRYY